MIKSGVTSLTNYKQSWHCWLLREQGQLKMEEAFLLPVLHRLICSTQRMQHDLQSVIRQEWILQIHLLTKQCELPANSQLASQLSRWAIVAGKPLNVTILPVIPPAKVDYKLTLQVTKLPEPTSLWGCVNECTHFFMLTRQYCWNKIHPWIVSLLLKIENDNLSIKDSRHQ